MPLRIKGPKPGQTANRKRKAENELSQNPFTKRSRERISNLSDIDAQIERAKNADRAAINRRIRKLKQSPEYQNASVEEKKRLEDVERESEILERLLSQFYNIAIYILI